MMPVSREYQADGWRRQGRWRSSIYPKTSTIVSDVLWEHRDGHQEWREYSRRQLDAANWMVLQ